MSESNFTTANYKKFVNQISSTGPVYYMNDFASLIMKCPNDEIRNPYYDDLIKINIHEKNNYINKHEKMIISDDIIRSYFDLESINDVTDKYRRKYFDETIEHKTNICRTLVMKGFDKPSQPQVCMIPSIIGDYDSIGQFKSGTGKTIAFTAGALMNFNPNIDGVQLIFMSSTHEIAMQIHEEVINFVPDIANDVMLCIGNVQGGGPGFADAKPTVATKMNDCRKMPLRILKNRLQNNVKIIVGTIGKIHDIICLKEFVDTSRIKSFVVDEFDAILNNKGNNDDENSTLNKLKELIRWLHPTRTQRVFFSATVNETDIDKAVQLFRDDSTYMISKLNEDSVTVNCIKQYYVTDLDTFYDKMGALLELIMEVRCGQTVIFSNSEETAERIKQEINRQFGMTVCESAYASKQNREEILKGFQNDKPEYRFLSATNVYARGVDAHKVGLVINFDVPRLRQDYIHRIGRSGRYGRKGIAISFFHKDEADKLIGEINSVSTGNEITELPSDIKSLLG